MPPTEKIWPLGVYRTLVPPLQSGTASKAVPEPETGVAGRETGPRRGLWLSHKGPRRPALHPDPFQAHCQVHKRPEEERPVSDSLRLGRGAQCPGEEKGLQLPVAWGSGEGVTRRGG